MTRSTIRHAFTVLFAIVALSACSKEPARDQHGATQTPTSAKGGDSADGTVDLGPTAYHPIELTTTGSVTGTITRDGPPTVDSVAVPAANNDCGPRPARLQPTNEKGLSNAIIWIADATSGKPLPIERRAAVASDNCELDPRVQAAIVGTTVNVENDDKALHKFIFTHLGKHDTLTVIPFFNTGEVVASERIAKATGIVEVRCSFHPWMRAYVAVFDHPYFAVTAKSGTFTIDSLPPGTYRVMVWHEGAVKPIEQHVRVAAGAASRMDLALRVAR